MSSLRVNSHTMSSVDRWLDRAARGRPSSSQPAKEKDREPGTVKMRAYGENGLRTGIDLDFLATGGDRGACRTPGWHPRC